MSRASAAGKPEKSLALKFLALMMAVAVSGASAHDMYLMPVRFIVEDGTLVAVGLHNRDSFPESEVSPALERVRDMKLLSEAGTLEAENMHVSGKTVQGQFRIRGKSSYVVIARTIPHALQLSAKDLMKRCAEPAIADWESSWASLTFELP